jgi:predicted NBD/HSP70 family sugar kinase
MNVSRHHTPDQRLRQRLALAPRVVPEDARRANRSLLLRALHHGGPASRADLSKLVDLTPATVSAVIKELLDVGLVRELGRKSGNVGKPATVVGIEPDGRHIATVSLAGPDLFVGSLVDLAGNVVDRHSYERDGRVGDAAVELVGSICDDLVANADRPVLGVGVASPGIVDPEGTVLRAARLGWSHIELAAQLRRRTTLAVHVANDANAAALAHLTFGPPQSTDFILVRIGQGVGAGIVLDGNLFRGARSAAGEIGHVVVDPEGDPCTCGKRGCLETVIAAPILDTLLRAAVDRAGAAEDDVLRHAGEHLGIALATVVSALDIGDIVLSGPQPIFTDTFRDAIADAVAVRTMPEISDELEIRPSSFGDDDVTLGAAALVLNEEVGIR